MPRNTSGSGTAGWTDHSKWKTKVKMAGQEKNGFEGSACTQTDTQDSEKRAMLHPKNM